MIEQRAQVIEVGEGYALVEVARMTTCAACSAKPACGTSVLAKVVGNRHRRMLVLSDLPLRAGDEVVVGIAESALVRGSFAVYIVPLVLMLAGAMMGDLTFSETGEALTVLLGGVGLVLGLVWLNVFTRGIRADSRFQPIVVRRLTHPVLRYERQVK